MVRFVKMMIIALLVAGSAKAQVSAEIEAVRAVNNSLITTATGFHAVTHVVEGNIIDTTLGLIARVAATAGGGDLQATTLAGNTTNQGIIVTNTTCVGACVSQVALPPNGAIQFYWTDGAWIGGLSIDPQSQNNSWNLPNESGTLVTHITETPIICGTASTGTDIENNSVSIKVSGTTVNYLGKGTVAMGSPFTSKYMMYLKDQTNGFFGAIIAPNAVITANRWYAMANASGYLALSSSSTGIISPDFGGTGIANDPTNTVTYTGHFSLGITMSANTSIGLPITGTLYGTRASSISSSQMLNSMSDAVGINHLVFSDNPLFGITVTFIDGCNFICGATTGTKFGTGTSQKMGWWNTTPVVQQSGDVATALSLYGFISTPTVSLSNNVTGTVAAANGGTGNGITTVAGTSYTLLAADWGHTIVCTSASAVTLTVPSGLPTGFECRVFQKGAGLITPTASGTTLDNGDGYTKSAGVNTAFSIVYVGPNEYLFQGRLQ